MNIILKFFLKALVRLLRIDADEVKQRLSIWSINLAISAQGATELIARLRSIIPDISTQEESTKMNFNRYFELKWRSLQAFQCALMLRALEDFGTRKRLTVVDIGDSAGTHMKYLLELTKGKFDIDTVSVNLDSRAIEKIRQRGLKAILCRAEDLDLGSQQVNLFTTFEMLEHLHNPAFFLRRLSKKFSCKKIVLTVPYVSASRVGLHTIRGRKQRMVCAEDEHIFELSPQDWSLLFLHAGWEVAYSKINYQYPVGIIFVSRLLSWFWKRTDFEGFWGAILTPNTTYSDSYKDWDE